MAGVPEDDPGRRKDRPPGRLKAGHGLDQALRGGTSRSRPTLIPPPTSIPIRSTSDEEPRTGRPGWTSLDGRTWRICSVGFRFTRPAAGCKSMTRPSRDRGRRGPSGKRRLPDGVSALPKDEAGGGSNQSAAMDFPNARRRTSRPSFGRRRSAGERPSAAGRGDLRVHPARLSSTPARETVDPFAAPDAGGLQRGPHVHRQLDENRPGA